MEMYKNTKDRATKKTAALRKGLKRKKTNGASTSKKMELDDSNDNELDQEETELADCGD